MGHLRSASPLLWTAFLTRHTTVQGWGHTPYCKPNPAPAPAWSSLRNTAAPVQTHTLYGLTHTHARPRVPAIYTRLRSRMRHSAALTPLSTNVFCWISMKSTVGEQDGIPHILQRYLRTRWSLPRLLSVSPALSTLPSWGPRVSHEKKTLLSGSIISGSTYSAVFRSGKRSV